MKHSPKVCPIVLLVLTLFHAGSGHGQTSGSWRDPSPHQLRWVTVEPGVRLEVLDWGGSGRPLVLLAGLGMTAHVFDGFAEKLTGYGKAMSQHIQFGGWLPARPATSVDPQAALRSE